MAQYDDSEFLTDSPEEIRRREERDEIRRIARTEFRRMQSGEAEEDVAEDIRREEEAREAATPKPLPGWFVAFKKLATGEILIGKGATRIYDYVIYIALLFFLSIVVIFSSLRYEVRRNRLSQEVDLLHERSIRMKEQRYQLCSHSSIVELLRERGIELFDPLSPTNVIEE
jgi:hypothetical protein